MNRTRDPAASRVLAERVLAASMRAPRRAVRLAERALAGREGLEPEARARLLRASGHALRAVGRYAAARAAYRAAQRLHLRLGLAHEHAIGAIGLVDACMYLGREREGLDAAARAAPVFVRLRDLRRLAMLETNVGNLHHRAERLEEARVHYLRAARLLRRRGTPAERAGVDHNLANVLIHMGRRAEAESLFRGALAAFTAQGQVVPAAQVRYGLACLRFLSGEYAAAIAELEAVRPALRRAGARGLCALADLDLAEVLLAIRLNPEAAALAASAGRWFRARGMNAESARCQLTSGLALALQGRPRSAARALTGADRLFRADGVEPGRAAVALGRAHLARTGGRPITAARLALGAYQVFERAGFGLRALAAGAVAGEALLAAGRLERAGTLARVLQRRARQPGDGYSRARLARIEGAAAARRREHGVALAHYRQALREATRAHSALFVDEWQIGFLEGEPALLDEALGSLLARRPAARAEEVWRWLASAGNSMQAGGRATPPPLDTELRRRVAGLRDELQACYARLWRQGAPGEARGEALATRRLGRRALLLEGRLRRLAATPESRGRPRPVGPAAPPREPGVVRIVYFAAAGRLCALRFDDHGSRVVRDLGRVERVEEMLRLFHYQMDVLADGSGALNGHRATVVDRARGHLATLGRLLLDPVLDRNAPPGAVRITPYGALFRTPFHALLWRGQALVETSEVAIDPSVSHIRTASMGGPRGALVLGFGGGRAGAIEQESRAVAEALEKGGLRTHHFMGSEATCDAFTRHAPGCALIHLSGHAIYRREHPEFSALRLGDGWLHARDLAAMSLEGATVVLSACETGPRGAVAGDEMLGLVRGFEQAGARAVVASLWRVDDRETLAFMHNLYGEWRRARRLGGALRAVQRRAATRGRDPYLWAPFCLLGDPSSPWRGHAPG